MGTKRDLKAFEQRRLRGARLLKHGIPQAKVARQCEVSCSAVSLWAKQMTAGGRQALRRWSLECPAALGETERRKLIQVLKREALAAEMIERLHGVRSSTTQV